MKSHLTELIVNRLTLSKQHLKKEFSRIHPIKVARHFALDDLLPLEIAEQIHANFPNPKKMHLLSSRGKIKLKYCHLKDASQLLRDMNAAIQDPHVVAIIEDITGIKNQIPDPTRFAGGISTLLKGYYLNPHIDNSHDLEVRQYYRTVNMLYYASPNWKLEDGGHFELWDEQIENRIIVPSFFNRLVVMETNRSSWHAVNPVTSHSPRCCIFNYFFSKDSPEGMEYFFNQPSFKPRPEQTVRRAVSRAVNKFKIWKVDQ